MVETTNDEDVFERPVIRLQHLSEMNKFSTFFVFLLLDWDMQDWRVIIQGSCSVLGIARPLVVVRGLDRVP